MYLWRKLNKNQRAELLAFRQFQNRPWHSPAHLESLNGRYLLTAACYEHRSVIGLNLDRMAAFSESLLAKLKVHCEQTYAWCVLPNHDHALVLTRKLPNLLSDIGRMHGKTAFDWNGEEGKRGRKVWFNCAETGIKSDRHFWATLNYVHHNPVHHGYVSNWQEWPFSSGAAFVANYGRERAIDLWRNYPIETYGKTWDPSDL